MSERKDPLVYGSYPDNEEMDRGDNSRGLIGDTFKKFRDTYQSSGRHDQRPQDYYDGGQHSTQSSSQSYQTGGYSDDPSQSNNQSFETHSSRPPRRDAPYYQSTSSKSDKLSSFIDKIQGTVSQVAGKIGTTLDPEAYAQYGSPKPTTDNRYGSFMPERGHNDVKWYVDGCSYMYAVSRALASARESIWILDWWLSPELYLRRPPAKNEQYRLDRMLQEAAQRGVQINVIIYKEVKEALPLSSAYTKHRLEELHSNIAVFRHPDHLPDGQALESSITASLENLTLDAAGISKLSDDALKGLYGMNDDVILYWAHHEKLCLIDGRIAFMGGLDLCYGRWDTYQHAIADVHPADLTETVFPGQDYNNARVFDFEKVSNWQDNKLDRKVTPRMGWSDISVSLHGPVIEDLRRHFVERWNFIYDKKYYSRKDSRYFKLVPYGRPASSPGKESGNSPRPQSQQSQSSQNIPVVPPPYGSQGQSHSPRPQESSYGQHGHSGTYGSQSSAQHSTQSQQSLGSQAVQGTPPPPASQVDPYTSRPQTGAYGQYGQPGTSDSQGSSAQHIPPPPPGSFTQSQQLPGSHVIPGISLPSSGQEDSYSSRPQEGSYGQYGQPGASGNQGSGQHFPPSPAGLSTQSRQSPGSQVIPGVPSTSSGQEDSYSARPQVGSYGQYGPPGTSGTQDSAQHFVPPPGARTQSQQLPGPQRVSGQGDSYSSRPQAGSYGQYGQPGTSSSQGGAQHFPPSPSGPRQSPGSQRVSSGQEDSYSSRPQATSYGQYSQPGTSGSQSSTQHFPPPLSGPYTQSQQSPGSRGPVSSSQEDSYSRPQASSYGQYSQSGASGGQGSAQHFPPPQSGPHTQSRPSPDSQVIPGAPLPSSGQEDSYSSRPQTGSYGQYDQPGTYVSQSSTQQFPPPPSGARTRSQHPSDSQAAPEVHLPPGGRVDSYTRPQTGPYGQYGQPDSSNLPSGQHIPPPPGPFGPSQSAQGPYFVPPPTQELDSVRTRGLDVGGNDGSNAYQQHDYDRGMKSEGRRLKDDLTGFGNVLRGQLAGQIHQYQDRYLGSHGRQEAQSRGSMWCQIVRSSSKWSNGTPTEHSVSDAYATIIRKSRHFVYIENQFFITATSDAQKPVKNRIGEAIVERILRAARAGEKYKIIVVIPSIPGFPGDLRDDSTLGTRAIMAFQYNSINRGGNSIMEVIAREGYNPLEYIRFYNLRNYDRIHVNRAMANAEQRSGVDYEEARKQHDAATAGHGGYGRGAPVHAFDTTAPFQQYQQAAQRAHHGQGSPDRWDSVSECYMLDGEDIRNVPWDSDVPEIDAFVSEELYIHTKVLIADDRIVICGSANLNDRSQLGRHDSEIAVVIEDPTPVESTMNGGPWTASRFATSLRRQLFRKHLGLLKPQDYTRPDANFEPVGIPNDYDWDSPESRVVADPLSDTFQSLWNTRARTNTDVFRQAFHVVPDDNIRNWASYKEFFEYNFHKLGRREGDSRPPRYEWGHVVRDNFAPGPEGVKQVKELLSRVKGTLVEMPLMFLIEEDIAQTGLTLNNLTEPLYT